MAIRIVILRDEQQMVFEGARARRVRLQTGDKVLFEGADLQKADFRLEGRDLMVEVEGEGQFVLEGFYDRDQGRTVAELVLDEETLGQILGALQPTAGETAQTEGPENEHHFRVGFTDVRRYDAAGIDGVGQESLGEFGDQVGLRAPSAGVSVVSILTDVPSIYGGNGPTGPITGGTNAPVGVDDVVGPIDENATVSRNTRASGVLGNDTDADPTQQGFLTVSQVLASTPGATAVAVAGSGATTLEGAYGTLTIRANGTYAYSADAEAADRLAQGASAQELFTYTVRDADGRTSTATLTIRINGVNDAPSAVNDSASLDEGGSVTGDVIEGAAGGAGRDSDAEGDALTVTGIRAGATGGFTAVAAGGSQVVTSGAGSLTINSDGTYSYSYGDDPTLATGQTRIQTFSYQVSDGRTTSVATLSVTIRGGDGATAVNDTVAADEDSGVPAAGDVLANDIDRGNGPLSVVGVGSLAVPAGGEQVLDGLYGSLTIRSDGTYTYNPDDARDDAAPQGGSVLDTFSYTIRDTLGRTSTGTLSVQIRGTNDDPTAVDDQVAVNENATVNRGTRATGLLGNDTDPDQGETATLTVASVQDAAGADINVAGAGNTVVTGAFGSLTIAADGTYTYAANGAAAEALPQGETALDTFTYTIRDAQGATSQATFTVTVTGQNDAPVAANDANSVDEGGVVNGDVIQGDIDGNGADTDVDGDTLTVTGIRAGATGGFTAVTAGGSQVVTVGAGSLTINSDGTYSYSYGDDPTLGDGQTLNQVFTYQVSDGTVSRTANLTITVRGNSGPVGTPDVENVQEDSGATVNGNVLTNDIDRLDPANPRLSVIGVNGQAANLGQQIQGQFGTLVINADGTYTYILDDTRDDAAPEGGILNDVFTYTLRDLNGRSSLGTLTIRVAGANDDPTAVDDQVAVNENATVNRGTRATGLLGNDTDPDQGETATLTVASVQDAAGTAVAVAGAGNTVVTGAFGSLTIAANGTYTYAANDSAAEALPQGETALDTFTYTIRDAQGATSQATFTVTVTGQNDAPVAINDAIVVDEDELREVTDPAQGILANDTDLDTGETATLAVTQVSFGAASANAGEIIFGLHGGLLLNADGTYQYFAGTDAAQALAVGQTGIDVFTYTVRDAQGATSTATLTVTVRGQNDAPSIGSLNGDTFDFSFGTAASIDAADALVVQDVDTGDRIAQATAFIAQGAAGDTLSVVGAIPAGIAWAFDPLSRTLTITGLGTPAQYQALLRNIRLTAADDGQVIPRIIEVNVTDQHGATSATSTVTGLGDLFTGGGDTRDFNDGSIVAGRYRDGSQYNALGGADRVILASTFIGALTAGYDPARAFDAGAGADTVIGGGLADTIMGGSENDSLSGGANADSLMGGTQDDTLDGGAGADTLDGGAGTDLITFASEQDGGVEVNLETGQGRFNSADGDRYVSIEQVVGSRFDDTVTAASAVASRLEGGEGNDILVGGTLNDTLIGGDGADSLVGNDGADLLQGGAGADTLQGGFGADTLDGGAAGEGNWASYSAATSGVRVNLGVSNQGAQAGSQADQDVIVFAGGVSTIQHVQGGTGADTITGDGQDNSLVGGAGDDVLFATAGGSDLLDGGTGVDTVNFSALGSGVTVDLLPEISVVVKDAALGFADTLSSIENVVGTAFNDFITSGVNANRIDGGSGGVDIVSYQGSNAVFASLFRAGIGGNAHNDVLTNIDWLIGSDFNDTLEGDGNANTLQGGTGADSLFGGDRGDLLEGGFGDDTLSGGDGNDTLVGGDGADRLDGGTGIDLIDYSGSSSIDARTGVEVNLATGQGRFNEAEGDVYVGGSIENVIGSDFNDTLIGTGAQNSLAGGAGDDLISGGGGPDTLDGGEGENTVSFAFTSTGTTIDLTRAVQSTGETLAFNGVFNSFQHAIGTDGNDRMIGDSRNNRLDGGRGANTIFGGDGDDTLVAGNGADSLSGGVGHDLVSYENADGRVVVRLAGGALTIVNDPGSWAHGDQILADVEGVIGSRFDDTLQGRDATSEELRGGEGDDSLIGGNFGGNDTLNGGGGADTIDGRGSTSFASYATATSAVLVRATDAGATLTGATGGFVGEAADDVLINILHLIGSNFADTLFGTNANNTLDGGHGADLIVGGGGIDAVSYASARSGVAVDLSVTVQTGTFGQAQTGDTLQGDFRIAIGSAFADTLTGNGFDNTLVGGAGADLLNGAGGTTNRASYFNARTGVFIDLEQTSNNWTGDAQGDTLTNIQEIEGSAFADTIFGSNLRNDVLIGGGGADFLFGRDGNDTLDPGVGAADTVDGGDGIDTVSYLSAAAGGIRVDLAVELQSGAPSTSGQRIRNVENIIGSAALGGNQGDTLTGNGGANRIEGMGGQDSLAGGGGDDTLVAGAGQSTLDGGAGRDQLIGDGNEVARYSGGPVLINFVNTLSATGSFNDAEGDVLQGIGWIVATAGADTLSAQNSGASIITLEGGDGGDWLISSGNEILSYAGSTVTVDVNLQTNVATGGHANGDTLTGTFAGVLGGSGDDVLVAADGVNSILNGGAGNDGLFGGSGNDTLIGGSGRDTFFGGGGNDYASYITSSSNVSINFVTGLFTNDAQNDLFHFSVEVLQLTSQSDLITLNSSRAWEIRSEGGNDTINAEAAGNQINVLLGGAGDDQIRINAATGQFGVFSGELGNDTLQLGTGVDLDLTQGFNQSRMTGIETIDLAFGGNHQLALGATHLANNLSTGTLRVLGDSGDRVQLSFGLTGWTSVNNGSTTTYTSRDNGRSIEIENSIVTQIV